MPTLTKILEESSSLSSEAIERLNQLVGDWQIISDIAFSDLVLYVHAGDAYMICAQVRPATAATLFETDLLGLRAKHDYEEALQAVYATGDILTTESDDAVDTWVPVPFNGETAAVLRIATARVPDRVPSTYYANFEAAAHALVDMVSTGDFPADGAPSTYRAGMPHVANGVVFMDEDGVVTYASPNAVTNFRKYGIEQPLAGHVLVELVAEKLDGDLIPDETLPVVLMGKAEWIAELESRDIVIMLRAVPLIHNGERCGALLLCRDVTRIRMNERELMSKDATIKEINHRVKNNLQTVSALLRLQARRANNEETRASLESAQRRVEMIAIVHEKLSQTIDEVVDFDEVFGSLLRTVRDVAVMDAPVDIRMEGSFGRVRAEQATALAVVLNEIISNAIEHGLAQGGYVHINAHRQGADLSVRVQDNGEGMKGSAPTPGISSLSGHTKNKSGLGTQIVRTLVASELKGVITWSDVQPHGTLVKLEAHVRGEKR